MFIKKTKKNVLVANTVPTLEERKAKIEEEELTRIKQAILSPTQETHNLLRETVLTDFQKELGHVKTEVAELGEHFHLRGIFKKK